MYKPLVTLFALVAFAPAANRRPKAAIDPGKSNAHVCHSEERRSRDEESRFSTDKRPDSSAPSRGASE
jgi:hypothetical protein